MYNIFGSTIMAIIVGIIFGLLFRNHIKPITINNILLFEIAITILGVILIILFNSGKNNARTEHEHMVLMIIRNIVENNRYWWEKFPESYFSSEKKYDESLKIAEYLTKKNPKSSYALFNLGIMYYRIEDLESAISCFQKAIQKEEANPNPKQKMIEMYRKVLHDLEKEVKKKNKK